MQGHDVAISAVGPLPPIEDSLGFALTSLESGKVLVTHEESEWR